MNLLGTTGTRATAGREQELVDYLRRAEMRLFLHRFDGFVSGGCRGWDAIFGRTLALEYPDKINCVILPWDREQIDPWWDEFDLGKIWVIPMPESCGKTVGERMRARNTKIVELCTQLLYCADYPEEHGKSKRSGTWMTVRIARASNRPVSGFTLNTEGPQ